MMMKRMKEMMEEKLFLLSAVISFSLCTIYITYINDGMRDLYYVLSEEHCSPWEEL